jgi:hypothetical protein
MPMSAAARIPSTNPYGFNPQPEPPRGRSLNIYGFNPQPEPPRTVPPGIQPSPLGALDDSEKKGFWRGAIIGAVLGGLAAFVIGTGIKRSW